MSADSDRDRLPFEPNRKRKKADKARTTPVTRAEPVASQPAAAQARSRSSSQIPEVVSRRMLRRMIIFSGIPVSLGVLVFFASYVIITQQIAELPNVAVLLTTLGCFGLSVLGLSYGALSASWDEHAVGGILGLDQFKLNVGRVIESWRAARAAARDRA